MKWGACDRCGHDGRYAKDRLCLDCADLSSNLPVVQVTPSSHHSVDEKPQTSSLIPLATSGETEVDELLRMHTEGRIEPVVVELPALPPDATDAMRQVAEFFALVAGLRLWAGDSREVLFAGHWVAEKIGLPHRTVARALTQLVEQEVLVRSGVMPRRGQKTRGTYLYEPARVTRHLRRVA